ncbi:SPOR domain-containing protein [Candidatus Enterovibrio escicola]|uniref:SPOR domain-containing protein n=1 Tax=Candidatus Enterovibrio escicola TaxID=1927127 RepID=UPI001237F61E|nr:SPOR domain-containing protein [Candidatus Enterovibrio escacola]
MATRDYVKRGKKPLRPPKNTKKLTFRATFDLRGVALAIVLVGAFGYALYYLSTNNQSTLPKRTDAPLTTKSKKEKSEKEIREMTAKKTLPPQPREHWFYINELENKEVKIETNEQKISNRPYLMQCGAYRNETQADGRKAMIAFQGLDSNITTSRSEKGIWYRVVLGPYQLKREAEHDKNMLRRANIEPCAIWYWN